MKIEIILTCHNRKDKTIQCIQTLLEGNPQHDLSFIITDDASTDGTGEALLAHGYPIVYLKGAGDLYWCGGMRQGIDYFMRNIYDREYVMMINDDVSFFSNVIDKLIDRSKKNRDAIVVGATCDDYGRFTYGAQIINKPIKRDIFQRVEPSEEYVLCDTFNCNCVLIKSDLLIKMGNLDDRFRHSLADLDYGLRISGKGYPILSSSEYVGVCNKNSKKGTWQDVQLRRIERLRLKESVKGAPLSEWYYFMKKNFGLRLALLYSISPYIKILLGK